MRDVMLRDSKMGVGEKRAGRGKGELCVHLRTVNISMVLFTYD